MSAPIRFGTEGFRGVIARDFTFAALHRLDLPLKALLDLASLREPRPLAGFTPRGVDTLDGVKWLYEEAWVLFRASGTEPVVRVYVEATSPGLVQALLEEARKPVEE